MVSRMPSCREYISSVFHFLERLRSSCNLLSLVFFSFDSYSVSFLPCDRSLCISFFFLSLPCYLKYLSTPTPRHSSHVYSSPSTLRRLFPFPCRSPHLEGHHSPAEGQGEGEERAVTLLIFKYTIVLYYGSKEVKTTFGMTPISPRSCRYFPRCLMV